MKGRFNTFCRSPAQQAAAVARVNTRRGTCPANVCLEACAPASLTVSHLPKTTYVRHNSQASHAPHANHFLTSPKLPDSHLCVLPIGRSQVTSPHLPYPASTPKRPNCFHHCRARCYHRHDDGAGATSEGAILWLDQPTTLLAGKMQSDRRLVLLHENR